MKNHNSWQINNNPNGFGSQVLYSNMSTTPWPALNQIRNQMHSQNNNRQNMWVQNGTNWIRNSPMPTQVNPSRSQNSPKNNYQSMSTASRPSRVPYNKPYSSVVNFVTNPNVPANSNNNRNNVNVNFLNNERTNIPGGNFSSGSLTGTQDSITSNQGSVKSNSNGEVTDDELREFSETLLSKDVNNAAKYVTLNVQKMTTSRSTVDEAPLP